MKTMTVIDETLPADSQAEAEQLDQLVAEEDYLFEEPEAEELDATEDQPDAAAEQTSAALLQEHLDYNRRLIGLRQKVVQCERNVEDRKEELKAAKEELDLAHKAIDKLIDDFNCEMPLFDGLPDSTGDTNEAEPSADVNADGDAQTDDESWKTVSLHDLTMPGTTAQKLAEAEIRTLGDLSAWTESGKLLTDVKGISEKAAEKIEAALDEFWGSR